MADEDKAKAEKLAAARKRVSLPGTAPSRDHLHLETNKPTSAGG